MRVSEHWAWSREGGLQMCFFGLRTGRWSRVAANEAIFQGSIDGLNANH